MSKVTSKINLSKLTYIFNKKQMQCFLNSEKMHKIFLNQQMTAIIRSACQSQEFNVSFHDQNLKTYPTFSIQYTNCELFSTSSLY